MTIPLAQAEFVDGLMQMCMARMGSKDYAVAIRWLSALVAWMPTVLADSRPKRASILAMLAESHLAINEIDDGLQFVNQALETCYSVDSFLIKLKIMLALSVDDIILTDLFKTFKLTGEMDAVFELFRMVADAKSAELAFDCLSVAFPNPNALESSLKQDLAIVKLVIAADDKLLPDEQKVVYTRSVIEAGGFGTWSDTNRSTVRRLLYTQSERCVKRGLFGIALKWLDVAKVTADDDAADDWCIVKNSFTAIWRWENSTRPRRKYSTRRPLVCMVASPPDSVERQTGALGRCHCSDQPTGHHRWSQHVPLSLTDRCELGTGKAACLQSRTFYRAHKCIPNQGDFVTGCHDH